MAQCHCRWRNVFICVCTPCILLALLLAYVTIVLCTSMSNTPTPGAKIQAPTLDIVHFVAPGLLHNGSFAPLPTTFWALQLHENAFWNKIQLTVDRYLNPILRPSIKMDKSREKNVQTLMWQSFNENIGLNSTKKMFNQLPQEMKLFMSHMQERDYPVLIQPDKVCGAGPKGEEEHPLLVMAIKTSELNFKNRQAIRKTWGRAGWIAGTKRNSSGGTEGGGYVRRVFLLGKEDTAELGVNLTELLHIESQRYGDILQWDFRDTFFNLTLKDVLFWKWFSRFCSKSHFVFKGDDDVFVNTPKMITYLQDQLKLPQVHRTLKDFMIGDVISLSIPNPDIDSKYFVPESFYMGLYPAYAGGGGLVYSGLLAKRLHNVSKKVHLFPIDDAYVGMCMVQLNAQPIHHHAFLMFDFPKGEEGKPCAYHTILVVHKRSPTQMVKLWAHIKETETQCWEVPLRQYDKKDNKKGTQKE